MNWADARQYCRANHTDLATIESSAENSKLNGLVTSDTWIGLNDDSASWRNKMGKDRNSWRWSSTGETSKTGYQNWQAYKPDYYDGLESCAVLLSSGKWDDKDCDTENDFVCYDAPDPQSQKTYVLVKLSKTWSDALAYCRTHHTDLAMIEDAQENEALLNTGRLYQVWIGLYRNPWKWSSNRDSSYRNWKEGQPNNYLGNQHCAFSDVENTWQDASCSEEYPFLCEEVPKIEKTILLKIHTDADLSDPAISNQLLQKISAQLSEKMGRDNLSLKWKIQPQKKEEEKDKAVDQCPAK
ncbi:macrophage mannose receptor 1-like [Xyrichtys novacula]|uniref:Macrophage mannose receptor 1-like n=1 Tax=Xyrichtys novacula TaxID=13765 RepID=A0AAV1G4X4_XYRNO|nr:macrophage mannose receptor 1-like [Xyrichtys novacula]